MPRLAEDDPTLVAVPPTSFIQGDAKNISQELRRRIALQMIASSRQRAAPKTFGEGLTAIGDALGDRGQEERLLAADAEANKLASTLAAGRPSVAAVGDAAPAPGATGPVLSAPIAPPPGVLPPPPQAGGPPVNTATPSPLPPASRGAMPPVVANQMPGVGPLPGSASDVVPITPPGTTIPQLDPRSRAALAIAAQQRAAQGGPQVNPTVAGSDPATPIPPSSTSLAPATTPSPIAGGSRDTDFSSQNRGSGISPAPQMTSPIEPLTADQRYAVEMANKHRGNEAVQAAMKQLYDQEEVGRAQRQAVRTKIFGHQLSVQEKIAEEQRVLATPEGQLKQEKLRLEVEKARKGDAPTESQAKAGVNHARAFLAHDMLTVPGREELLATSKKDAALGSVGLGSLASARYKLANNAAENFVQAFIRNQSGGAYGDKELEHEARGMLPRIGDDARLLEQKRLQRERFLSTVYGGLSFDQKREADAQAAALKAENRAKQARIDAEMAGVKPKGEGDVKIMRNEAGKIVAKRVWSGSAWLEDD